MKISATIVDELAAAGHPQPRIGWNAEGVITFPDDMPQPERNAIQAVFTAHDPLPGLKTSMKDRLNEIAEQQRAKLLTRGSAKALEYQQKYTEAVAILADPNPLSVNYPFAAKRAARFSMTLTAVANEWKTKGDLWITKGAEIIDLVDGAAVAIAALTDPITLEADAQTIIDAIVWPTP